MNKKNNISLKAGSTGYTGSSPGVDSVGVFIDVEQPLFLVDISQLPKDLDLDVLVARLEDNHFLAKYYLEKEYNIKSK